VSATVAGEVQQAAARASEALAAAFDALPAPMPVLEFRMSRFAARGTQGQPRALALVALGFDYGGTRVAAHDDDDGIPRNRGAEIAAEERLEALGLAPLAALGEVAAALERPPRPHDWVLPRPRGVAPSSRLVRLLPRFEAEGFRLEFNRNFPIEVLPPPESWFGELSGEENTRTFGLRIGVVVRGERIALLPALRAGLAEGSLSFSAGARESDDTIWLAPVDARRRVPLPMGRVRAILSALTGSISGPGDHERLELPRAAASVLSELTEDDTLPPIRFLGRADLTELAERLAAPAVFVRETPAGLNATLRGYQLDGLAWLRYLAECGLGGVLADDMGLGKTVQVLAHLLSERAAGRLTAPALVVVPTSLIPNWRAEVLRFAPDLRVAVLHGQARDLEYSRLAETDLALTSYALLVRDRERIAAQRFSLLVLDEAQAIKNARSKSAEAARALPIPRKLAVSGTPLENHLGELWSLMDCVLPGLLGSESEFSRLTRIPIERHDDPDVRARLNRRIAPFILRRTKEKVAPELPAKTVIERRIELGIEQRVVYERWRMQLKAKVEHAVAQGGPGMAQMLVLEALLRLRQVCCDPRLIGAYDAESAKLDVLLEMLEELIGAGRRVLVYSQFTRMLDLIQHALSARAIKFLRLDGATRDRETPVKRFQAGEAPVFLISLKAGGVGLNLTAADTVIHYDPWWNPAAEEQAADRAHRIGQHQPVFVYKLICAGTVEERVRALQQRKAALVGALLEGGTRSTARFDPEDLDELFAPLS